MALSQPGSALAYLEAHGVQDKLIQAIKHVVSTRPDQPIKAISDILLQSCLARPADELKLLSWNVAAINNNPFEYWLTHPNKDYATLMEDVERFMSNPAERDIPVKEVFTPAMYECLDKLMTAEGWEGADTCAKIWAELSERPIVSGFLKDKGLGDKRLMSMPDRVTNTIDVVGSVPNAFRPSAISSFEGDMATIDKWWPLWHDFMFSQKLEIPGKKGAAAMSKRVCELLVPIPRSKYPALTEEEAVSMRLQTLCLAIFDAILVHMLATLSEDGQWVVLKSEILEALTRAKEPKQIAILGGTYASTDVICLQEVRTSTMRSALPKMMGTYEVVTPSTPSKVDQNSVLLLSKARFESASVTDLTAQAMAAVPPNGPSISPGDLLVVSAVDKVSGRKVVLASFHGDTDGLATAPALAAVHAVAASQAPAPLLFGLDANTYAKAKPGKQAAVADFIADCKSKGYHSNFGDEPLEACLTTSNARTFLQPQLQKSCKASDKKAQGDFNPKDHLLYSADAFELVSAGKDNTGKMEYIEDMVVPTLDWPSDHGLIYASLRYKPPALDVA